MLLEIVLILLNRLVSWSLLYDSKHIRWRSRMNRWFVIISKKIIVLFSIRSFKKIILLLNYWLLLLHWLGWRDLRKNILSFLILWRLSKVLWLLLLLRCLLGWLILLRRLFDAVILSNTEWIIRIIWSLFLLSCHCNFRISKCK